MKTLLTLAVPFAVILLLTACKPEQSTDPKVKLPPSSIHPLDTGPQLDTNMLNSRKDYSLDYQNDARTGFDVNDSPQQSHLLAPGTPVSGLVGTKADPADIYRVEVPDGKQMMVSFSTGRISLNLNLEIWDDAMAETWSQYDMDPDANVTYDFPPDTSGTFYLIVSHSNGGGPYQLTFKEKGQ